MEKHRQGSRSKATMAYRVKVSAEVRYKKFSFFLLSCAQFNEEKHCNYDVKIADIYSISYPHATALAARDVFRPALVIVET